MYLDPARKNFTLTWLEGQSAFHQLKEEWVELWKRSTDATQFQRWEWQYLYFKHILPNAKPRIIVVRDFNGKCVALVAFCKVTDSISGLTKVSFLGDLYADYHMILCRPDLPYEVGFQIFDYFFNNLNWHVSILELKNIPEGSWTELVLSDYLQTGVLKTNLLIQRRTQTYAVSLPNDFEKYTQGLGSASRRNIIRDRRRLEKDFIVRCQAFDGKNDLEQCLAAIETIDRARWKQESRYCDPAWRSFLISLMQSQVDGDIFLSFVLFLSDKPAAYVTGVGLGYIYKTVSAGYDPEISNQISIGKALHFYAIEACIRKGFVEYDMTRGSESYKEWLGAGSRNNLHIRLYRSRITPGLAKIGEKNLEFLRQQTWLRRIYQRFVRGEIR